MHLYGHPAPIDRIAEDRPPARRGAGGGRGAGDRRDAGTDARSASWGDAACLSFYPTKNLGACGDAGLLLTDRDDVAERVRRLRHHGDGGRYHHLELGYCSRLDEMQAAMLRVKLRRLDGWTERAVASPRATAAAGRAAARAARRATRARATSTTSSWCATRSATRWPRSLADLGVGTMVHYPLAVPEQPLFGARRRAAAGRTPGARRREVLSLPCYPEMTDDEVDGVIAAVQTAVHRV